MNTSNSDITRDVLDHIDLLKAILFQYERLNNKNEHGGFLADLVSRYAQRTSELLTTLNKSQPAQILSTMSSRFTLLKYNSTPQGRQLIDACLSALMALSENLRGISNDDQLCQTERKIAAIYPELGKAEEVKPVTRGCLTPLPLQTNGQYRPLRTLAVEDDFISRTLVSKMLSRYGQCDVAIDGYEGIAGFLLALENCEPYDLVCVDIMMPQLDGRSLLRLIRGLEQDFGVEAGQGAKVIMTTALNDSKNVVGSFNEGCEGYLVKPLNKEKLQELLTKLQLIAG